MYIHETLTIHLSTCDKFNFIVSLFYHTPSKSYGPDFNPTMDTKDRFWTRGQFASQATILDLHAIFFHHESSEIYMGKNTFAEYTLH